jgi:hypothetical protein
LNELLRRSALRLLRARDGLSNLANGINEVAGAAEIWAQLPVQQKEQQDNERDYN